MRKARREKNTAMGGLARAHYEAQEIEATVEYQARADVAKELLRSGLAAPVVGVGAAAVCVAGAAAGAAAVAGGAVVAVGGAPVSAVRRMRGDSVRSNGRWNGW